MHRWKLNRRWSASASWEASANSCVKRGREIFTRSICAGNHEASPTICLCQAIREMPWIPWAANLGRGNPKLADKTCRTVQQCFSWTIDQTAHDKYWLLTFRRWATQFQKFRTIWPGSLVRQQRTNTRSSIAKPVTGSGVLSIIHEVRISESHLTLDISQESVFASSSSDNPRSYASSQHLQHPLWRNNILLSFSVATELACSLTAEAVSKICGST